jgi:integrative and conjugative element protein (TIGR02256 family)
MWSNMTPELILPLSILAEIRDIVYATATETGVRLIGIADGGRYLVRHVIGPGPEAVERRYAYECDNDHAEECFTALLQNEPELKFLGELHVHPDGFPHLSGRDRRTIAAVLRESPEFIAGVMQRNPLRLYPYRFTRHSQESMEVCYDLCPKPERTRSIVEKACAGRRLWQRWLCRLRDAGARRNRRTHAD